MDTKNNQNENFKTYFSSLDPATLGWLAGLLQAEAYFYVDNRVRSKIHPPPPAPGLKLEMIDKDVVKHDLRFLLDQEMVEVNRKTSTNNTVYKVTVSSRFKPYFVGEKIKAKIETYLGYCEEYYVWVNAGGKSEQAKRANLASQESKNPESKKTKKDTN